jgi:D-inositol-3-phosphate glycosyltransferase
MISHSPHLRAKLAVVIMGGASGSGDELEKLKTLTKFLKIEDVTHFINPVSRDQLPDWYRASDLVCVPSYSESFGLVALEAQACGTPVVATAIGGLRTAVSDGISGSLVDEPARRLLLSMGAVEHASHFGWENTARKTLDVYDWVLSKQTRSKLRLAGDA